jgi:hypothetical protein
VHAAIEDVYQVKGCSLGLVTIYHRHLVAPLGQSFGGFPHLHPVATAPGAGVAVVNHKDFHGATFSDQGPVKILAEFA